MDTLLVFGVILLAASLGLFLQGAPAGPLKRGSRAGLAILGVGSIGLYFASSWTTPQKLARLDCKTESGAPQHGNHPIASFTLSDDDAKAGYTIVASWCEVSPMTAEQASGYTLTPSLLGKTFSCELATPPDRTVTPTVALCRALR